MSKRWLTHKQWIAEQFDDRYLPDNFRNTIIHAIILEGVLRKESKKGGFKEANINLLKNKTISELEFQMFDAVRDVRNKIAHEIVKTAFSQKDLDRLIKDLAAKILKAYQGSVFMGEKLFKEYGLKSMLIRVED